MTNGDNVEAQLEFTIYIIRNKETKIPLFSEPERFTIPTFYFAADAHRWLYSQTAVEHWKWEVHPMKHRIKMETL